MPIYELIQTIKVVNGCLSIHFGWQCMPIIC